MLPSPLPSLVLVPLDDGARPSVVHANIVNVSQTEGGA